MKEPSPCLCAGKGHSADTRETHGTRHMHAQRQRLALAQTSDNLQGVVFTKDIGTIAQQSDGGWGHGQAPCQRAAPVLPL